MATSLRLFYKQFERKTCLQLPFLLMMEFHPSDSFSFSNDGVKFYNGAQNKLDKFWTKVIILQWWNCCLIKRCQLFILNVMFNWIICSTTKFIITVCDWIWMWMMRKVYWFSMFMYLFFIKFICAVTLTWLVIFVVRIIICVIILFVCFILWYLSESLSLQLKFNFSLWCKDYHLWYFLPQNIERLY